MIVEEFRDTCAFAVLEPAPLGQDDMTDAEVRKAADALGRTWAKAGFEPLHERVWIRDLQVIGPPVTDLITAATPVNL